MDFGCNFMEKGGKSMKIAPNPCTNAKGTRSAQLHSQERPEERAIHAKNICPDEHREDAQMITKQNEEGSGFP